MGKDILMGIKQIDKDQWRIDISIYKDGKEYRHREVFTGGIKAAKDREYDIKKALRKKSLSESGSLKFSTFAEALEYYKSYKETSEKKIGRSVSLVNILINELGTVKISVLKPRFEVWLDEMRKTRKTATINRYIAWSNAALNLAVKKDKITENPLKTIEREKERPRERKLDPAEEKKLLETIEKESPHLLPIVQYALFVPCRKGELISMKREWYKPVNNWIEIPEGVTKNRESCIKPVPEEMRSYFSSIPEDCPWLFYRKDHLGYHSLGDFKKSWSRCLRLAKIKGFRFHDLRRCSYSKLILAGNSNKVVQTISGHKTDMSRVYLNIKEEAANVVMFRPKDEVRQETRQSVQANS